MVHDPTNDPQVPEGLRRVMEAQTEHPVWPRLELSQEEDGRLRMNGVVMDLDQIRALLTGREERIRLEREEPFWHGYEPPAWDEIDWEVARLRVRCPGIVLEVLICGANGGGKSYFAAMRTCQVAVLSRDWLVWCHSEDEPNSERIQQRNIYHYLPSDYKTDRGSIKKTQKAKLSFNVAGGFTDNKFSLHNGTVTEFRFWSKELTTLEGVRPHFAWTDEEVPLAWMEGITRRLLSWAGPTVAYVPRLKELLAAKARDPELRFPREEMAKLYQGVHLITFTPKSGYTPTVRQFVAGAVARREVEADLLPLDKHGKVQLVPKLQYCQQEHRIVYYLHAYDNVHAGNWAGMRKMARGKPEREVKWWCYGVTERTAGTVFPKWRRAAHLRPLRMLPKEGTWYMVADPVDGKRNWFMLWVKVNKLGELMVAREWPCETDHVPGIGLPGPWAVPSMGKRVDGDPGPAQQSFGGGFRFIAEEIRRVERELGELEWLHGNGEGRPQPIVVMPGHRIMDARAGNTESLAASEAKTLIQSMAEVWLEPDGRIKDGETEPGLYFIPAGRDSGSPQGANSSLSYGYKFIEDLLDYDDELAVLDEATGRLTFRGKAPRLYVAGEHVLGEWQPGSCSNLVFAFENLTGADGLRAACKDPMDGLRYVAIAEPRHVGAEGLAWSGGGYY